MLVSHKNLMDPAHPWSSAATRTDVDSFFALLALGARMQTHKIRGRSSCHYISMGSGGSDFICHPPCVCSFCPAKCTY